MKVKTLSLVAGAIALTLTATPFAAQAQRGFSGHKQVVAQNTNGQRGERSNKGAWQQLGLTDAQKTQIQQIRRDTRTQIEGILTQEQKDQLKAQFEQRQAQRGQRRAQGAQRPQGQQPGEFGKRGFESLNLTEDQKTQIKQIMQTSQQKIQALLTPEQRTKLQQMRENARARWQQRNSNQGTQQP
ncbi:P pilus assembly/Cpx signaling pathway, periplasmic inhibitor/zinc-resistance associated protein [Tolypothrix sp. PCC 7910]|uniref:Spy/CpxP family protein refolding chaperone n=1 Tax=Tolypothrix sp. PCC 7910 TaxID=2099387 RepID=UPI00142772A1|nr:P pilus assembly/Cpx signaling pathway, periplasmic inhibitor/zinc-resistance associated protein [Tolypothrix sp. PCC 7910]QIR40147.1 P pilus assembly/Cpx signaling pathway, periplasmic inhibitor/zinc-resistance associated protein [Tolypothrix sp. PCC 7910]